MAGIAIITSLFGAAGAGLTGYKMNRRVGGIDEFEFQPLTTSNQLAITIAISGWLSDDKTSETCVFIFLILKKFTFIYGFKFLICFRNYKK